MKIFIDTNILLDLYHLSGADLDEIKKVLELMKKDKVELLVSRQVEDEFWRNREDVINDALKRFRETKAVSKIPNIVRTYGKHADLKAAIDNVNNLVKELENAITQDINENKLKADELIVQLFGNATPELVPTEVIDKARLRAEIGNPPGKKGSIGDAINWEWLLTKEMEFWDEEFVIISADADFESALHTGKPKEFLQREWKVQNPGCELILYKSLPDFLKDHFSAFQISDEVDKILAIEKLENSSAFASTHAAIALLNSYGDFSNTDVIRILKVFSDNNQVRWILGDVDVMEFAKKIVSYAETKEANQLAKSLLQKISEIENVSII